MILFDCVGFFVTGIDWLSMRQAAEWNGQGKPQGSSVA